MHLGRKGREKAGGVKVRSGGIRSRKERVNKKRKKLEEG